MKNQWSVISSLLWREVVRFIRQKNRVIGALGTPILFWFLIGSGLGSSFQSPLHDLSQQGSSLNYLQYFFPGTVALILLFTAIFSTISIIEDRREGFLQAVLVSPAARWSLALGKILGGTILATAQGLLFLAALPLVGIKIPALNILFVALVMLLLSFGLTGLGFLIAWRMDSTQGFHAIMNLVLMPLWFLSGALFPLQSAPTWLRWIMTVNPVTYGVMGLYRGFFHDLSESVPFLPSAAVSLAIIAMFSSVMFGLSMKAASRTNP